MPSDVGLADGARRRTPGLRREEVALLANIGTTWYTRLEQGLPINVSTDVLAAIARALRLTSDERRHLYLARGPRALVCAARRGTGQRSRAARARNARPIAGLHSRAPLGRSCVESQRRRPRRLLRVRPASGAISSGVSSATKARSAATGDLPCAMRRCVANFRTVAAKYPNDPAFTELIDDLRTNSHEFRQLWAEHDVLGSTEGLKKFLHPELGEFILDYTAFDIPGRRRHAADRTDRCARLGERAQAGATLGNAFNDPRLR